MIVRLIATSTRMMGGQPNEATSPMVIFRPQKRDTDAEHERTRKADTGLAAFILAQKVQREAENQSEQHDRSGRQCGSKTGRGGNHDGREDPGADGADRRPRAQRLSFHATFAVPISFRARSEPIKKTAAAAVLAKGSN